MKQNEIASNDLVLPGHDVYMSNGPLVKRNASIFGFYASLVSFLSATGFCVVQFLQLIGVIVYPLDSVLIFSFSLGIAPGFLMAIHSLHAIASSEGKFWSRAALLFALLYAVYVILMYTVQLSVVIPDSLHNHLETILTVKPQSLFWTIDALGYICMGISTLFAAFLFKKNGLQRWLRRLLIANGIMVPVITFVYFYPHFSTILLLVATPWVITTPGSLLLLTLYFKRTIPSGI